VRLTIFLKVNSFYFDIIILLTFVNVVFTLIVDITLSNRVILVFYSFIEEKNLKDSFRFLFLMINMADYKFKTKSFSNFSSYFSLLKVYR
jgi:hypothetical protein